MKLTEDEKELLEDFTDTPYYKPFMKLMDGMVEEVGERVLNLIDTPENKDAIYNSMSRYKGASALKQAVQGYLLRVASSSAKKPINPRNGRK